MKEERKKQLEELYAAKVQAKAEEISKWIYEHPEDGDQEFLSSAYICEQLKETGFSVQLPYGSLKTAFRCELKGSKPGATYAFLAEYDALPGYGEQHDELAHACGHNWIGAVCAGVGLMFAQMQEELEGTIVIMGTPAEETTGGKCVLVEEGAFDDVDFAFQLHLGAENNAHVVTLAMDSLEFTFHGKAAHAAAYPHLGVNALDAVNLMFTGISYLRQQLRCDTRVHGIITKGGEACNIIPDLSVVGRDFYTYWFRTDFIVPADYKGKVIWLQLDGINYRAEVWVNGHLLSNISGMFIQDYVDITEFARVGETNALAVKVYPVDMSGTVKQKQWGAVGEFHNGGDGNIGLNTTMLMSVGWDFTFLDGIRDRNTGIWKSISLYATDKAAIRNPFIRSELAKPGYDKAEETVSVEVINPTTGSVKCVVAGEITGENIRFSKRDKPFSWRNS